MSSQLKQANQGREHKHGWVTSVTAAAVLALISFIVVSPYSAVNEKQDYKSRSLSHLKQISIGFQIYASDNEGLLPDKAAWQAILAPYVKVREIFKPPFKSNPGSYAMNMRLSSEKLPGREGLSIPLAFESNLTGPNSFGDKEDLRKADSRVGVALTDGSVKSLPLSEAQALTWVP